MRGPKREELYMAVTNDEYELPVCVGTRTEVAAFMGIKAQSVSEMLQHKKKKLSNCRIAKYTVAKTCIDEEFE